MSKLDNIKRAKRLKEAKRKREQDTLIAAGLGPAGKALQNRSAEKGIEIRLNESKIKYSELLKEFVHPIISEKDNLETIKTKYTFGAFAWNAATVREKSEEAYLKAKKELMNVLPNDPDLEQMFDEMVNRKNKEFSEFKKIIADFEIKKIYGGDYDLTVATAGLNED